MRVDAEGKILRGRAHLDGEHAFGDEFARAMADDAHAQHALGGRVNDELGHAVGAVKGQCAPASSPREFRHADFDALGLRLGFGQAAPGDLGVGEDDSGDDGLVCAGRLAGDDFHGGARLARGLVRKHHAARDVADGVDGRVGGLLFLVHHEEALFVELGLGVFEAEVFAVRRAAHGDEDAVVEFFLLHAFVLGDDFDLLPGGGHLQDLRLHAHLGEILLRVSHHRPREVGVGAEENAVERLDDGDFAAERGVNRAQLHADVAAADDEQLLGNLLNLQRLGGGHYTRVAEVESLRQRGLGADGDDGVLVADELLPGLGLDAQGVGTLEVAASVDDGDAALRCELGDAAGELGDDGVLPRAELVQLDLGRGEGDAAMGGLLCASDGVSRVEQGLGGDAAAVEAHAAELGIAFKEDNFLAEVGSVEGSGISAGASTYDDDFSFGRFHVWERGKGLNRWLSYRATSFSVKPSMAASRSTVNRAALPPSMTRWS